MKLLTHLIGVSLCVLVIALGCSGGGNPTTPAGNQEVTSGQGISSATQTHLWGYYDVYIDIPTQTATAVVNRNAMFTANVTQFINGSAANLVFHINGTPVAGGNIDVDIDVTIKHPFPGMHEYDGCDVRGVFIGNGSQTLNYKGLKHSKFGASDQIMFDYGPIAGDPHAGYVGMPDGYTRWFNPPEFGSPGLFGYTVGMFATPGYTGTAEINPYKYFADGLGLEDDLYDFLTTTTGNGTFAAGSQNTRNYYLRFPSALGVKYQYAVIANWEAADVHPSNAPEACGIDVEVTPDIYYIPPGAEKGGKLKLFMSFPTTWGAIPTGIRIESTVLSTPHQFTPSEMMPVSEGINYSTYHVEIPADNITGNDGNEFWVIAEYSGHDYKNTFGTTNLAGNDPLAAFFRYPLEVATEPFNQAPIVDSGVTGKTNPLIAGSEHYVVTAHDPDGDPLTYAWTVTDEGNSSELLSDDPGNGDGTIDIFWGAIGAKDGGQYDVDCVVSDGMADTPATTLEAIATSVVYLYDGSVDDGGMEVIGFQAGPNKWQYLPEYELWDENGSVDKEENNMCVTLATPDLNIPSDASDLIIEVTHSGNIYNYYGSYSMGSGMIGYTTDGGNSINFSEVPCDYSDPWLKFDSGQNFNFPSYYYGDLGFYTTYYMGCQPFSYWVNTVFCDKWGAVGDPTVSTWRCGGLLGMDGVRFCFNYNSGPDWLVPMQGMGWQINKIKVYVEP